MDLGEKKKQQNLHHRLFINFFSLPPPSLRYIFYFYGTSFRQRNTKHPSRERDRRLEAEKKRIPYVSRTVSFNRFLIFFSSTLQLFRSLIMCMSYQFRLKSKLKKRERESESNLFISGLGFLWYLKMEV